MRSRASASDGATRILRETRQLSPRGISPCSRQAAAYTVQCEATVPVFSVLPDSMPQPRCAAVRAACEFGLAIEIEMGGPSFWNGCGGNPMPSSGHTNLPLLTCQNSPEKSCGGACDHRP